MFDCEAAMITGGRQPENKAVLRFLLSGNTSFWSQPEVATRIGFGTAPWRCISSCQTQYYASAAECAPDCISQAYCEPGGMALSDPDTTCCLLNLLDQLEVFGDTSPPWCSSYPSRSLRHVAAWHHPSINITEPPEFSLVDDLVCLPLEEIFDPSTWICDRMDGRKADMADFGFPGKVAYNLASSYFMMMLDPCGLGRALVQRSVSSLNPNLALRTVALEKCLFAPFTELNAMRWSNRARLEWSEELQKSLESIKYGNQSYPRGFPPPVVDPVAARPFLPDTLKRLTIKRTNDGRHPTQAWQGKPVIKGFLPAEWALLKNLEHLDLSDEMGEGLIEGPIPSTWLMMTKLRTINLTGHTNFCKDWHRIVSYQIQWYTYQTPYGAVWGLPKRYYGPIDWSNKGTQWNVTVYDMDGLGWQWYDPSTGEAGYTNIIAPDGKCCWDTFSDQFAARNYTLTGPSGTSGPWDYYGLSYERAQLYCFLTSTQASFAIPVISRGPFYIAIAVPDLAALYCKVCGCVVEYTALARGASSVFGDAPETQQASSSSSRPETPEPAETNTTTQSPNGTAVDIDTAADRGPQTTSFVDTSNGSSTINYAINTTASARSSRDSASMAALSPPPTANSLEERLPQGIKLGREGLKEVTVMSSALPSSPALVTDNGTLSDVQGSYDKGPGLGAAWRLDPGSNGDYLFKIQVGDAVWYRWVVVDMDPPAITGALYVSSNTVVLSELASLTGSSALPSIRHLMVLLNMSEPVQKFNLASALQLNKDVYLVSADCYESATAAVSSLMMVASSPMTLVKTVGSLEVVGSSSGQETVTEDVVNVTASAGKSYVRSCLAVMYAPEVGSPSVTLPAGAVKDTTGNPSTTSLVFETQLEKNAREAAMERIGDATKTVLGGVLAATAVTGSVSALSSVSSQSSMLQSAYHIQMLAMSSSFASPGISSAYRKISRYLRWSLMGIKGNIPVLDNAFSSQPAVNDSSKNANQSPRTVKNALQDSASPVLPPPPAGLSRRRDLAAAATPAPLMMPPSPSKVQPLTENSPSPRPAVPTPYPTLLPPRSNASISGPNILISFLRRISEPDSAGGNGSKSSSADAGTTDSSAMYAIAGGGDDGDDVNVDSSGRIVNGSWGSPGLEAETITPDSSAAKNVPFQEDEQDLVYTTAVALIIFGGLLLAHAIAIVLFKLIMRRKELPPILQFPRVEVDMAGLLLVALTYFSFDALAQPGFGRNQIVAVLVLTIAVLPYFLLLWWITSCRWYLEETPIQKNSGSLMSECLNCPRQDTFTTGTAKAGDSQGSRVPAEEGAPRVHVVRRQTPIMQRSNVLQLLKGGVAIAQELDCDAAVDGNPLHGHEESSEGANLTLPEKCTARNDPEPLIGQSNPRNCFTEGICSMPSKALDQPAQLPPHQQEQQQEQQLQLQQQQLQKQKQEEQKQEQQMLLLLKCPDDLSLGNFGGLNHTLKQPKEHWGSAELAPVIQCVPSSTRRLRPRGSSTRSNYLHPHAELTTKIQDAVGALGDEQGAKSTNKTSNSRKWWMGPDDEGRSSCTQTPTPGRRASALWRQRNSSLVGASQPGRRSSSEITAQAAALACTENGLRNQLVAEAYIPEDMVMNPIQAPWESVLNCPESKSTPAHFQASKEEISAVTDAAGTPLVPPPPTGQLSSRLQTDASAELKAPSSCGMLLVAKPDTDRAPFVQSNARKLDSAITGVLPNPFFGTFCSLSTPKPGRTSDIRPGTGSSRRATKVQPCDEEEKPLEMGNGRSDRAGGGAGPLAEAAEAAKSGNTHLSREDKIILSITAMNVSHKAACAAAFGFLGRYSRSVLQMVLLFVLQVTIILQLTIWRPYVSSQQQFVEVVCHMAVLGLIVCAVSLLDKNPDDNHAPSTWIMIGCFGLSAAVVIGSGMLGSITSMAKALKAAYAWLLQKRKGNGSMEHLAARTERGS
ncbi:hypothetical protein VOLCADRAFT_94393 [Volvox carteri f. nagariensis]|uniref:Uncharacterized protein n=1 Tax=Volvox carteri f. nagariensis TaxID=3068 RepID=D8U4N6_VOLCA|nr:uncharacterized protein VOLCADRAFT_94393 [Volvox carteri f. nagariensis]EFJ45307.1 hypothetical protein VOLCADRAFT_94393 [Volvox carteri f. nagariensis]|eukprot:XP_002953683.1 hypothetical protein VOLCADRAFT_94393 [Volvox carteri f. nagariensis]